MIPITGQIYHIIFTTDECGHPYQGPGEYTGETKGWRYQGTEGKGNRYSLGEMVSLYGFTVEGRSTTYYVPEPCIFEHGYFGSEVFPYCQIDLGIAVELVLRSAKERFEQEERFVGTVNPEVMLCAMRVVKSWLQQSLDLDARGNPPARDERTDGKSQVRHVFEHQAQMLPDRVTDSSAARSFAERLKMIAEAPQKPKPDGKAGDAPRA